MSSCVMCNQLLTYKLSFSFLFSKNAYEEPLICSKCQSKFLKIDKQSSCPGCSRPQSKREMCGDCEKWQEKYPNIQLNHTALLSYNNMAREFMDQYKFQGDLVIADIFSASFKKALSGYQKTHSIVPIPLSPLSKATRGCNQVELLLKRSAISYRQLLEKDTPGKLQSSKSRKERLKTPHPYHLMKDQALNKEAVNRIVIVDDVYTTGRTLLHARLLLENLKDYKVETQSFSLFR